MKADTILRSSFKTISTVHGGHHSSFRVEWNVDGEGKEKPAITWAIFDWNTAEALADGLEKAAQDLRDLIEWDAEDFAGGVPVKTWVNEAPLTDGQIKVAKLEAVREFLEMMGKL